MQNNNMRKCCITVARNSRKLKDDFTCPCMLNVSKIVNNQEIQESVQLKEEVKIDERQ